ncbi:MAG: GNAT family N-acetyltransferase [Firmicutes bacterium]|nr:GNAT family N-acetyltransferase [Bacillota bacterium]
MYFKKIEGKKVYLSPMCVDDAEKFAKWMNDFQVTDKINASQNLVTVENEREWLEKNSGISNYQFAIVKQENDELIGNCSFHDLNLIHQTATIGIFIGDDENRGKGYGSEVLQLLLSYGFNHLNLNNIMLAVYSFNERAIACYKKVGFKEIGRRREAYFKNNERYDEIYMDILRSEFYEEKRQ